MAKAQVSLPDGIVVRLEGTAEEISAVVRKLQGMPKGAPEPTRRHSTKDQKPSRTSRPTLIDLIGSLIDGGFFAKKPQDLAAVKGALEAMGHHYPVTTLSGVMLNHVRRRQLRRFKQDKRWVYTH